MAKKAQGLSIWNDKIKLEEIKKMISSTPLSDLEFELVRHISERTQLNPLMKEIQKLKQQQKY